MTQNGNGDRVRDHKIEDIYNDVAALRASYSKINDELVALRDRLTKIETFQSIYLKNSNAKDKKILAFVAPLTVAMIVLAIKSFM